MKLLYWLLLPFGLFALAGVFLAGCAASQQITPGQSWPSSASTSSSAAPRPLVKPPVTHSPAPSVAPVHVTHKPAPKVTTHHPRPVRTTEAPSAYYASCAAARKAGAAPLHRGDSGYRSGLDRDGDGTACE